VVVHLLAAKLIVVPHAIGVDAADWQVHRERGEQTHKMLTRLAPRELETAIGRLA
jgi:hypothetical protein